jgi:membrane associated rhomboid family serine protease
MRIEAKKIVYSLTFPALFVLIIWLVWLLEKGLGANWYQWGVFPGRIEGLWGILTQPLIHSGAGHLFSNSVPLLVLGWCMFYFYKELSLGVIPCLWILSGFFTWLWGRESWHIGASGLIYAFSFFLFFSGIFRKYVPLLAISLLIAFLYGSIVWNMLPVAELVDSSVSWEGHLSGAVSGLICAVLFKNYGPQKPVEEDEPEEDEPEEDEWKADDAD